MSNTNHPAYNVFTVKDRGSNKKAFWIKIGAAWPLRSNGDGFSITLNAIPVDGKLVLVPFKEQEEEDRSGMYAGMGS